jgi:hypothetical protein
LQVDHAWRLEELKQGKEELAKLTALGENAMSLEQVVQG